MFADRTKRIAAARSRVSRVAPATDTVRDDARASASAGTRDVVVVNPKRTVPNKQPSRYADALFLAHVFASKFDAPQQREKRRADPADANAQLSQERQEAGEARTRSCRRRSEPASR